MTVNDWLLAKFKSVLIISIAAILLAWAGFFWAGKVRAKASEKAIALSSADLIEMNNISIDEMKLNLAYKDQMAVIHARYMALRDRNKVPADWINDTSGSTVVGFRPQTAEEKNSQAHGTQ